MILSVYIPGRQRFPVLDRVGRSLGQILTDKLVQRADLGVSYIGAPRYHNNYI